MENQEKYICKYCGSVRKSIYSLLGHERLCEKNQTENGLINRLLNADRLRKMSENAAKKNTLEKKEYVFKCPRCGNNFSLLLNENEYKNGRHKIYCSYKCSNVRERSEETKEKISNGVKRHIDKFGVIVNTKEGKFVRPRKEKIKRFCKDCGKEIVRDSKSGYCSKCVYKHINEFPERIENLKAGIRKSIEEGRHKGWMSRNIESYPEKFWKKVLDNNNIEYIFNMPFKRKFLDFVIIVDEFRKIDLEIDGRQHDDRIEEDIERDKFLAENGFLIHRIKWNEINSQEGKDLMKKKIENFLNFLHTL